MTPHEKPWTVKQTAEYLGISGSAVYRMVDLGQIPFYRVGGKIVFDPVEIGKFWRECKNKGVAA